MQAAYFDDDDDQARLVSTYEVYFSEGAELYKLGEYAKAIELFTTALDVRNDDPLALVARSKCYLRVGEPDSAFKDAENSLHEDKTFHRGILAKAEALYFMGDFEMALVYYHRGHKLRPELEEFFLGIQKAQEAIDNAIGTPELVTLSTRGDLTFMKKQSDKDLVKIKPKPKYTPMNKFGQEKTKQRPKPLQITKRRQEATMRQLLGRLYGDREFLVKLLKETERITEKGPGELQVIELCEEGIVYLDTRSDFWRQHKPMYIRQHEKDNMMGSHTLVNPLETSAPNEYVIREIYKIERAQSENKHEDSLHRAKRCLQTIEKYPDGVIEDKMRYLSDLHSLLGNAYMEMGLFKKSIYHHEMDIEIGTDEDIPTAISRGLDNVGRVYARTGRFQLAIDTWMKKLPRCKSSLESTWLYHEIGRCHLELGRYLQAQQFGELSLTSANDADNNSWRLQATVLLAQADLGLLDHRAALVNFGKALEIAQVLNDKSTETAINRAIDEVNNKIIESLKTQSVDTVLSISDEVADMTKADDDYSLEAHKDSAERPKSQSKRSVTPRSHSDVPKSHTPKPTKQVYIHDSVVTDMDDASQPTTILEDADFQSRRTPQSATNYSQSIKTRYSDGQSMKTYGSRSQRPVSVTEADSVMEQSEIQTEMAIDDIYPQSENSTN